MNWFVHCFHSQLIFLCSLFPMPYVPFGRSALAGCVWNHSDKRRYLAIKNLICPPQIPLSQTIIYWRHVHIVENRVNAFNEKFVNHVKNRWINLCCLIHLELWEFCSDRLHWHHTLNVQTLDKKCRLNDRFSCHYVNARLDSFHFIIFPFQSGSLKALFFINLMTFPSLSFAILLVASVSSNWFSNELDFSGLFNIGIFLHNFSSRIIKIDVYSFQHPNHSFSRCADWLSLNEFDNKFQ